jgi:hypothetical protein
MMLIEAEQKGELYNRKFTDEAKQIFLNTLAELGEIGIAAAQAGVTPQCIYWNRQKDEEFDFQCEVYWQKFRAKVKQLCWEHAFEGKPCYAMNNGQTYVYKHQYNYRLQELELKRTHPGQYDELTLWNGFSREEQEQEKGQNHLDFTKLTGEERRLLMELIEKAQPDEEIISIDEAEPYDFKKGKQYLRRRGREMPSKKL